MSAELRVRRWLLALPVLVLVAAGLVVAGTTTPASACVVGTPGCPAPGDTGQEDSDASPIETETHTYGPSETGGAPTTCHVYASGNGLGSYCVSGAGGGTVQTLKERFGGLEFDRCRFREVPPALEDAIPPNPSPDEQRAMMQICLENINFDTVNGGKDRSISFDIVWVKWTTDVSDIDNDLNDYLWGDWQNSAHLPVPHMQAQPIPTPVVGAPTYFTFTWLDPGTREPAAQGEYAGRPEGGPFIRVTLGNGMVMEAKAEKVTVDPNQEGMDAVTCAADARYTPGSDDGPCELVFPRSSADAEATSTEPIPQKVEDAFWATVSVEWNVRYGFGEPDRVLGDGFTMVLHQEIQVQEVQGLNQPPQVTVQ